MTVGSSAEQGTAVQDVLGAFGVPDYDIRDGGARYLVYGASIRRFLCVRSANDSVDALWIVCLTD